MKILLLQIYFSPYFQSYSLEAANHWIQTMNLHIIICLVISPSKKIVQPCVLPEVHPSWRFLFILSFRTVPKNCYNSTTLHITVNNTLVFSSTVWQSESTAHEVICAWMGTKDNIITYRNTYTWKTYFNLLVTSESSLSRACIYHFQFIMDCCCGYSMLS